MNSPFRTLPVPQPFVLPPTFNHASEHSIPSLAELHTLRDSLLATQDNINERSDTAVSNLVTFETVYRRAKDRVKGKLKARGDRDKDRGMELETSANDRDMDQHRVREKDRMKVKIKREYSGTAHYQPAAASNPTVTGTPDADEVVLGSTSSLTASGSRKP